MARKLELQSRSVARGHASSSCCFSRPAKSLACIAGLAVLVAVLPASAGTLTWQGGTGSGSAKNDWNRSQNWTPNGVPTIADSVVFTTSAYTGVTNSAAANAAGITFNAGASAFTLAGANTLTIDTGGITVNSANSQSFLVPIALNAAQTWTAASGNLAVSGTINNNAHLLTVAGAQNTTLSGVISGSGGLAKTANGTLTLGGASANLYAGGTTLSAGTIALAGNNALGSGAFNFAGGALSANNRSASLGALSLTANSTLNLVSDLTQGSLTFSSASWTGGILTINGWSNAATRDEIFITSNPGSAFLSEVQFTGYAPGAMWLSATGEIVPVPEPGSLALAGFGALILALGFGRRFSARLRRA